MGMPCSIRDLFEEAVAMKKCCRIVYRDSYGEHHALIAVPRDLRLLDGVEWGFFESEAGELLEVKLDDVVGIEPRSG